MARATSRLHLLVLAVGVPIAAIVIAGISWVADRNTSIDLQAEASARLLDDATRTSRFVTRYVAERRREIRRLAATPAVADAATAATTATAGRGLQDLDPDEVAARLADSPIPPAPGDVTRLLDDLVRESGFTDVVLAELNGVTVVATDPAAPVTNRNTDWWSAATTAGVFEGPAVLTAEGRMTVRIAVAVTAAPGQPPVGALMGAMDLGSVVPLLETGGVAGVTLEVAEPTGRIIATADASRIEGLIEGADSLATGFRPLVISASRPGGETVLVAAAPTDDDRLWVVAQQSLTAARSTLGTVRRALMTTGGITLLMVLVALVSLTTWLKRAVTQPVRAAGAVAMRVADGDLSVRLTADRAGTAEVGELLVAVDRMVTALQTLVGAIRASAEESAAMAQEISASAEQMSASTEQMASTCQQMKRQATNQAEVIHRTAKEAERILQIAANLAAGTTAQTEQNAALQKTAEGHQRRLLESSDRLSSLEGDLTAGTQEAESLSEMSSEIQDFVTQARHIASQTNMLSLNAGIEASRAEGGETRGFSVVADEVRKLAGQADRAATEVSATVGKVLATVTTTRSRLSRIAEGSSTVRRVARSAAEGLQEVADSTAEQRMWTDQISGAAEEARGLVQSINEQLTTLTEGIDTFVGAAEQIAAMSQEQTASIQEISASANQLAEAAEQLTQNVSSFRMAAGEETVVS